MLAAVGLGALPAQSATAAPCVDPYPVSALAAGDPVTGLTVTTGTSPDSFGGTVLGVLEDGIGPDVDMVLVDLDSPTIEADGIWAGMSGSPVYAADGRLIGAVSYSLGLGPSTVAGVTPAGDMAALLSGDATAAMSPRSTVRLPSALRSRVVQAGAATSAQSRTMTRLRVPVGMSGLGSERLEAVAPALNGRGLHVADVPAGPTSEEPIDIVTGGNLAASMSYGTITAAGVGTATAVCGTEVLGFGHPMNFTGRSSMSLHGARATHIQDDQTLGGYKVANLGAPVGTIDQDRLAGLHAVTGDAPTAYDVVSHADEGDATYVATSHVTMPEVMPDVAFANMLAAQDKVLDRTGPGTVSAGWTISGLRKDGTSFSFHRKDLYTDSSDVSVAPAVTLADDLYAISENPGEVVRITSVTTRSTLAETDEAYVIAKVEARRGGHWVTLQQRRPTWLPAGRTTHLKVVVTSRAGAPRVLRVDAVVPAHAAGRVGSLTVTGGNQDAFSSEFFFDLGEFGFEDETPAPSSSTFPQLLEDLTAGAKHNEVRATVRFRSAPGAASHARRRSETMNRVVGGHKRYRIVAIG